MTNSPWAMPAPEEKPMSLPDQTVEKLVGVIYDELRRQLLPLSTDQRDGAPILIERDGDVEIDIRKIAECIMREFRL